MSAVTAILDDFRAAGLQVFQELLCFHGMKDRTYMSLLQGLQEILLFLIDGYCEWRVSKVHRPLKTGLPTRGLRPLMADCCRFEAPLVLPSSVIRHENSTPRSSRCRCASQLGLLSSTAILRPASQRLRVSMSATALAQQAHRSRAFAVRRLRQFAAELCQCRLRCTLYGVRRRWQQLSDRCRCALSGWKDICALDYDSSGIRQLV